MNPIDRSWWTWKTNWITPIPCANIFLVRFYAILIFVERGRTKTSVTGRNPKLVISLTLLLGYGGHRHHGLCKTLRPNNRERSDRHGSTAAPVAAPPSLGSGHRTHLFMPCALRRSSRRARLVSFWFLSTLSNPASSSSSSSSPPADASRIRLYNFFLFHRTVSLCNSRQLRDQSRQFKFWYPSIVLMCCEILSYSRAPQRIISNWYANSRNNGDPAAFSSALVIFVDLGFERWRISHVLSFFSSGRRLSDHRLTPYFGCGDV